MQTDDLLPSEFSAPQNTVILHKPCNSNIPQSSFRAVSTSVFFVNCYHRDHFLSANQHGFLKIYIKTSFWAKNTPVGPLVRRYENQKTFPLVFPPLLLCPARAARRNFRFSPGFFLLKFWTRAASWLGREDGDNQPSRRFATQNNFLIASALICCKHR